MRLATLQTENGPRVVGVALDGRFIDLCQIDAKLPTTLKGILSADQGLMAAASALAAGLTNGPFVTGRLLAPISDPGKVICIGLNYRDHALETNSPIPGEPVVFNKFPQCVVGPDDAVVLPRVAHEVDYEAELVVVIGRRGKNISKTNAMKHVAGYTIGNDVSARDWQKGRPGGQWLLGKTPDTFAPTGPHLVTADEIDPGSLKIGLRLNGKTMQASSTRELIFGVEELIAHVSQLVTLQAGDLIFTGTPPGVGAARNPPVFIQPGDRMEVEIEGLGVLSNPVVAEAD